MERKYILSARKKNFLLPIVKFYKEKIWRTKNILFTLFKFIFIFIFVIQMLMFLKYLGTIESSQYLKIPEKVVGVDTKNCQEIFNSFEKEPNAAFTKKLGPITVISQPLTPMYLVKLGDKVFPLYIWFHAGSPLSIGLQNIFLKISFSRFFAVLPCLLLFFLIGFSTYKVFRLTSFIFIFFSSTAFVFLACIGSSIIYLFSLSFLLLGIYAHIRGRDILGGIFISLSALNYPRSAIVGGVALLMTQIVERRYKSFVIFLFFLLLGLSLPIAITLMFFELDRTIVKGIPRPGDITFFKYFPRTIFPFFYLFPKFQENIGQKILERIKDMALIFDFKGHGTHLNIIQQSSPSPIPMLIVILLVILSFYRKRAQFKTKNEEKTDFSDSDINKNTKFLLLFVIFFSLLEIFAPSPKIYPRGFLPVVPILFIFMALAVHRSKFSKLSRALVIIFIVFQIKNTFQIIYTLKENKNFQYYTSYPLQKEMIRFLETRRVEEVINFSALLNFPLLTDKVKVKDYLHPIIWHPDMVKISLEEMKCILQTNEGKFVITSYIKSRNEIEKMIKGTGFSLIPVAKFPKGSDEPIFEVSIIKKGR